MAYRSVRIDSLMHKTNPTSTRDLLSACAFTLVELMIVIALIALMLAILVPALTRTRAMRERVVCASRLHQAGIAATIYSTDNLSRLPTRYTTARSFDTFWMRDPDEEAANLGLLIDYVNDGRIFYCPTQLAANSPDIAYNTGANPWNQGQGPVGGGLNSSYATRATAPGGKQPNWADHNYGNKLIYSDFTGVDGWGPQGRFFAALHAPHESKGYNRLFGDGAVQWVNASVVNALRPVNNVAPNAQDLQAYYRLLDVLPSGAQADDDPF